MASASPYFPTAATSTDALPLVGESSVELPFVTTKGEEDGIFLLALEDHPPRIQLLLDDDVENE